MSSLLGTDRINAVKLVLDLGLKAKFCGLGLSLAIGWPWPWDCGLGFGLRIEVWPWPKIQGQNLGRLQNSPLTSIDWGELYFKIHVPYLLTVAPVAFALGWTWPWDCGLGLDSVWLWPWSVGLGLECSGLVNITELTLTVVM